MLRNIRWHYCG